jgi:regulatory protein
MDKTGIYQSALNRAMALCSQKEYCLDEIRQKLEAWGVSSADSEKILNTLLKEKFIDETRYANAFTRDKFRYNKWGKIKIASQLKLKKIPSSIIKESLDCLDYDTYVKMLQDLLEKQKKHVKARNDYELKGKLLRYGLSKGFESSLIYEILGE